MLSAQKYYETRYFHSVTYKLLLSRLSFYIEEEPYAVKNLLPDNFRFKAKFRFKANMFNVTVLFTNYEIIALNIPILKHKEVQDETL